MERTELVKYIKVGEGIQIDKDDDCLNIIAMVNEAIAPYSLEFQFDEGYFDGYEVVRLYRIER